MHLSQSSSPPTQTIPPLRAESGFPSEVPPELREKCKTKVLELIQTIHVAIALQNGPIAEISAQHVYGDAGIYVFSRPDGSLERMRYTVRIVHRRGIGFYPQDALADQLNDLAHALCEKTGFASVSKINHEDNLVIQWSEPLPPDHAWTSEQALRSIRQVFFPEQVADEELNNA